VLTQDTLSEVSVSSKCVFLFAYLISKCCVITLYLLYLLYYSWPWRLLVCAGRVHNIGLLLRSLSGRRPDPSLGQGFFFHLIFLFLVTFFNFYFRFSLPKFLLAPRNAGGGERGGGEGGGGEGGGGDRDVHVWWMCVCVCVCVRMGVCVQAPQGVRDVTVRNVHVCVRARVRTIYICSRRRKGFVT
jgi:hypothetical protein